MSANSWPAQTRAAMNDFYGNPSGANGLVSAKWESANLTYIVPPYAMVIAWDTDAPVKKIRVHKRCAESLARVLEAIKAHYGSQAAIEQARLHLYGGCNQYRLKRGGASLSIHSWGAAIDLDPERNAFGRKWSAKAGMMPMAVVELFRAKGWTWGGLWRKADAMHFQAANI